MHRGGLGAARADDDVAWGQLLPGCVERHPRACTLTLTWMHQGCTAKTQRGGRICQPGMEDAEREKLHAQRVHCLQLGCLVSCRQGPTAAPKVAIMDGSLSFLASN